MSASRAMGPPVMPSGHQRPPLVLCDEQHERPSVLSLSTSMPCGSVRRARIALACAQGLTNTAVAQGLHVSLSVAGTWRRRFLEGVHDEFRPGRPRTHDDEKVAVLINRALRKTPDNAGAWSVRLMAEAEGVPKRRFGLISQRAVKRGPFDSVARLVRTIEVFIEHRNASTSPFVATAESIFAKPERLTTRVCGTQH